MALNQSVITTVSTSTNDYVKALLQNDGARWNAGGSPSPITVYVDGSDFTGIQLAQIFGAIFLYENYANINLRDVHDVTANASLWDDSSEIWIQLVTGSQIGGFGGYSGTTSEAIAAGSRTFDDVTIAEQGRVQTFLASDGFLIPGQATFPDGTSGSARISDAGLQLLLHEFGHALGLKHPHDGGAAGSNAVFPGVTINNSNDTGDLGLNQTIYSIMSYNNFQDPIVPGGALATMATPMAFDIAALQQLYGANTTYHNGDDFYILPDPAFSVGAPGDQWSCIWDAGGTDWIVHNSAFNATIDLRPATLDNSATGGGMRSFTQYGTYLGRGFTIAGDFTNALADNGETGVIIENGRGGSGNDTIIGNRAANLLDGGDGADTLHGGAAGDTLLGRAGDDTIYGAAGKDGIDSGAGSDTAYGGAGSDSLNKLDADAGQARFFGEAGNDVIDGAQDRDTLMGGDDNDLVTGSGGADRISGGDGDDRLYGYWYAFDDASDAGDIINGNGGQDRIFGQTGNDLLLGGRGSDILTGGGGKDIFDFNSIFETLAGASRDIIRDFTQIDRIDLSTIDADTSANPGNDRFDFIGAQAFHGGGGEVRFAGGILRGDVNGDRSADFEIKVVGFAIAAADLVL